MYFLVTLERNPPTASKRKAERYNKAIEGSVIHYLIQERASLPRDGSSITLLWAVEITGEAYSDWHRYG